MANREGDTPRTLGATVPQSAKLQLLDDDAESTDGAGAANDAESGPPPSFSDRFRSFFRNDKNVSPDEAAHYKEHREGVSETGALSGTEPEQNASRLDANRDSAGSETQETADVKTSVGGSEHDTALHPDNQDSQNVLREEEKLCDGKKSQDVREPQNEKSQELQESHQSQEGQESQESHERQEGQESQESHKRQEGQELQETHQSQESQKQPETPEPSLHPDKQLPSTPPAAPPKSDSDIPPSDSHTTPAARSDTPDTPQSSGDAEAQHSSIAEGPAVFNFTQFLQEIRSPAAEPVARRVRSFLKEFAAHPPILIEDQTNAIHEFLAFIEDKMRECEPWQSMLPQNEAQFDTAVEAMEKLVVSRLWHLLFSPAVNLETFPGHVLASDDIERDHVIDQRIRFLRWITPHHLELPIPASWAGPWIDAGESEDADTVPERSSTEAATSPGLPPPPSLHPLSIVQHDHTHIKSFGGIQAVESLAHRKTLSNDSKTQASPNPDALEASPFHSPDPGESDNYRKASRHLIHAQAQLQNMNHYKSPRDKLICLLNASRLLYALIRLTSSDQSADTFMPFLVYTILRAKPAHLLSNINYIQRFRSPSRLFGQDGYYLASLSAAVHFIEHLDASRLADITPEQFHANVSRQVAHLTTEAHSVQNAKIPQGSVRPRASSLQASTAPAEQFSEKAHASPFPFRAPALPTPALPDLSKPLDWINNNIASLGKSLEEAVAPGPRPDVHQQQDVQEYMVNPDDSAQLDDDLAIATSLSLQSQPPAPEEAMASLRAAFPQVDADVIHLVLDSHNGNYLLAVDALLEMSNGNNV